MVKFKRRKVFRTLTVLTLATFGSRALSAASSAGVVLPADLGAVREGYFLGDEGFYIFRAILKVLIPPFATFPEYEKVAFINTENIIRDCLGRGEVAALLKAVAEVNRKSFDSFRLAFYNLGDADKKNILVGVERDLKYRASLKLIKKMAFYSFFTSEYGATKKLRYSPVPGSFIGSVKLKKGDASWAE